MLVLLSSCQKSAKEDTQNTNTTNEPIEISSADVVKVDEFKLCLKIIIQ